VIPQSEIQLLYPRTPIETYFYVALSTIHPHMSFPRMQHVISAK